jgi:kynurenine formamidase
VIESSQVDLDFPFLDGAAAEFLAGFSNLKIIGIDSITFDAHGQNTAHHRIFNGKGNVVLLETIIGVRHLPETFTLFCLPLHIREADGAPCRAYAEK